MTEANGATRRYWYGLVGGIVCTVGVFAPILTRPLVGSQSYFQNGQGDGTIVFFFGVSAIVATLMGRYAWNWIAGFGSLAVIGFTFIQFQMMLSSARNEMEVELAGNPFAFLGEIAIQSVQLSWGFPLLVAGSLFVVASAASRS